MMIEMTYKKVAKVSLRTATRISIILVLISMVLALISKVFVHSAAGMISYVFWVSGVLMNLLFLNNIGAVSVKLIILFLLTIGVTYQCTNKRLRKLDYQWCSLYIIGVSLGLAVIVSVYTYLGSLMIIPEFSMDQVVFKQQPFLTLIRTFVHSVILLVSIKFYLIEENQLNSGLVAFRKYFYYSVLMTFVISVIADIYLFRVVADEGLFVKYAHGGLIIGVFNMMAYVLLLLFGGVTEVAIEFVNNRDVFVLSFIDFLQGDYGSFLRLFFVIGFLLLVFFIGWATRKISVKGYIIDGGLFSLAVIIFNGLLVLLSGIDLDVSFVRITIGFSIIPVIITTMVILFVILLVRYMVLLIKNSI